MRGASTWRAVWLLVVTVGIGLGLLEWGPLAVLGCVAAVSVVTAPLVLAVRTFRIRGSSASDDHRQRGVVPRAVAAAVAIVACWAVVRLAPSVALLLLTLAVVTSPVAVGLVRRAVGPRGSRTARVTVRPAGAAPRVVGHGPEAPPPVQPWPERPRPQGLDDLTLCRLWRQSFWDLANQSTLTGYLQVVAWRQCCLDEIERRDAHALHAWLESGARASSGPEKFLRHPPGGATDAA